MTGIDVPSSSTPEPSARLISEPKLFFRSFGDRQTSWPISLGGYYLITLWETFSNLLLADPTGSPFPLFAKAIVLNVVAVPIAILFWGVIWFWLGSKMMRGSAGLSLTVKALGYANLVPGLIGTPLLCVMSLLFPQSVRADGMSFLVVFGIAMLFALWAVFRAWTAVRGINNFSVPRMLFVFLWLPVVLFSWILIDEFLLDRVFLD